MAVLLQIKNAHKSYGDQVLLDGAEATLTDDVKVGFVGRNGAGKSTLLRVLLGEEELDRGEVIRHPKLRLGYLRQHDPFLPGETALDFLMRDSGQPDWKCGEVAGQFELKGAYLEGPVAKLSGGWQTRVKLAALLLHEPNLLLLDEPTNFLDLRTQILLEHFLRQLSGGLPDRLARPGVSRRDVQPHARSVARQADDVSRQDRRLSGISAGAARARRRARTPPCWPSAGTWKSSSPRTRPAPAPPRGPARRASSSNGWRLSRSPATSRPPTSARRIVEPREGPGPALPRPGDRLSRAPGRRRHRPGDRSRLAGGDRRRQRPGQDDVPADRRRFARAAGRRSPLGLRLPDRHLCPARLHQPAREADGAGLPGSTTPPPAPRRRRFSTWPGRCCFAASR